MYDTLRTHWKTFCRWEFEYLLATFGRAAVVCENERYIHSNTRLIFDKVTTLLQRIEHLLKESKPPTAPLISEIESELDTSSIITVSDFGMEIGLAYISNANPSFFWLPLDIPNRYVY